MSKKEPCDCGMEKGDDFFDKRARRISKKVQKLMNMLPPITVGCPAPSFKEPAYLNGNNVTVDLETYRGKYVVLAFYCKDFSYVCPTELIALNEALPIFKSLNTEVIGISIDSLAVHQAFCKQMPEHLAVGHINFPLVSDTKKCVSACYGLLTAEGIADRATVIVDDTGIIRYIHVHGSMVGRSVEDILRELKGIQTVKAQKCFCPGDWLPGMKTIQPLCC